MKRREFSGNEENRLPKGKVEPYRLWFEYLKLALIYPEIKVDKIYYADWGDVSGSDFDTWWSEHWKKLFATNPETRVVKDIDEIKQSLTDPKCVVMRVSLTSSRKQRIKDIDDMLKTHLSSGTKYTNSSTDPLFVISSKRSINYATLRGMLRYLTFFKDNNWDIDEATLAYYKWSKDWNDRVTSKKLKLPLVFVPSFLTALVEKINKKKSNLGGLKKVNNPEKYDLLRNAARKFLKRGERILKNVAVGRFPGQF